MREADSMEKWQHQWENSDRGRSYFKYHPNISEKCRKDFPSKPVFAIITSLRSVSFHLTTINISPIKLIVQTVYAVNQKQYIIIYCNAQIMRKKGKDLELNSISQQEV
jgi:hypothetical protein